MIGAPLRHANGLSELGEALREFSRLEFLTGVPPTSRELGRALERTQATATARVRRLLECGYLEPNPELERGTARSVRVSSAGWTASEGLDK